MNIAFVHEWLAARAGSEKALEAMLELYPNAPLHALIYDRRQYQQSEIAKHPITTSFIQRLPFASRAYRTYLPLMPFAVEQFNLDAYDVIVSSSHAVAKGVLTRADQLHISYVYTPMRYAWDLYHQSLADSRLGWGPRGLLARMTLHRLRLWDRLSADRVDTFVGISRYIADRIRKVYRREAEVIYPPVDIDRFRADRQREDFFLTVSRMVPYKRIDLIAAACTRRGLPLVIIGDGPDLARVRAASGPTVRILGPMPDNVVNDHLERCKAFIFAADEDFGIAPVEAQAAGAPVLALARGGSLETVKSGITGLHFPHQTTDSICEALDAFLARREPFQPEACRAFAEGFSRIRFQKEISALIDRELDRFRKR